MRPFLLNISKLKYLRKLNTLLLARGVYSRVTYPRYVNLQQLSLRTYVINVRIVTTGMTMLTYWHVAIVTDKLGKNARFRLNITY